MSHFADDLTQYKIIIEKKIQNLALWPTVFWGTEIVLDGGRAPPFYVTTFDLYSHLKVMKISI